jgi:hypothetical protein
MDIGSFIKNLILGLSPERALSTMGPLVMLALGMIIYAIIVFTFYTSISRRDIFRVVKKVNEPLEKIGYGLEYVFLFPIIAFLWFFVMSALLSMLSQTIEIGNIFLVSMMTIATIRVTSYYDEHLSREVAKIVPFGLLSVFILDISHFSVQAPYNIIMQLPAFADVLIYYFLFILILELALKMFGHYTNFGKRLDVTPVASTDRPEDIITVEKKEQFTSAPPIAFYPEVFDEKKNDIDKKKLEELDVLKKKLIIEKEIVEEEREDVKKKELEKEVKDELKKEEKDGKENNSGGL